MGNYLVEATSSAPTVSSGGSVTVTVKYQYDTPLTPAPTLHVGGSPAFKIVASPNPSPLTAAPNESGSATIDIRITIAQAHPPDDCVLLFNGLNDKTECAVTVTP